ncbi:MAG: FkbM family methyltransferase [Alphaproteobacteria bacterium]|nr:FkbM family methyltransferase [Alphaproteobacteria bacterium]
MSPYSTLGAPRGLDDVLACERFVLFGAGGAAGEVERFLAAHGKSVIAFADNAAAKQGTTFRGKPVWAPSELGNRLGARDAIVIASAYQTEIASQLADTLGPAASRVFPFLSGMFAPQFGRQAVEPYTDELGRLRERLSDEESKTYLDALIAFRWTMDARRLRRNPRLTGFYAYDAPHLGPKPGDLIIDCGAYTGDTALLYLKRLDGNAQIVALEPVPANFSELIETIAREGLAGRITPLPLGAGETPSSAHIASDEDGADPRATLRKNAGGIEIRLETLDCLLSAGPRVGFIKIDVEGFEPAVLRGARRILGQDRPGLAVAAYHLPEHLWQLPQLIDELAPGYRLHLGHHPASVFECELFLGRADA